MTGDLLALSEAILRRPADDVVRLAWADCLEENGGDPARAELVRLQVNNADVIDRMAAGCPAGKRASDLLVGSGREWLQQDLADHLGLTAGGSNWIGTARGCHPPGPNWVHLDAVDVGWERGFVGQMVASAVDWTLVGPTVLKTVPVRAVILTFDGTTEYVRIDITRDDSEWTATAKVNARENDWHCMSPGPTHAGAIEAEMCSPDGWLMRLLGRRCFPVPTHADINRRAEDIWGWSKAYHRLSRLNYPTST